MYNYEIIGNENDKNVQNHIYKSTNHILFFLFQMEIKVDPKDLISNPWNVDTLEEFLYYCCPECDLHTKDYAHFYDHAINCHQKAKETLEPQETELQIEDFDVKVEVKNEDISESDEENEPLVKRYFSNHTR